MRKFVLRAARLEGLVELGSLPAPAAAFLEASVRAGLNIPGLLAQVSTSRVSLG